MSTNKFMDSKRKIIKKNKEGLFNYEIIETYQAGIVLSGPEVKSTKGKQISLKGSYVSIDKNAEAWLVNAHISHYKPAKAVQEKYDPDQNRKLLLRRQELTALVGKSKQKGLTIIPVCVYTVRGLIKVDIALARGRTKIDKRESIKKREVSRQIRQTLKRRA